MANPKPRSTCPICDCTDASPYCTKSGHGEEWRIDRCPNCGHGFVVNRPRLERLVEIYSKQAPHGADVASQEKLASHSDAASLAGRVARLTPLRGPSLDVGCGDGSFSYHLQAVGFRPPFMIDLDPQAERAASVVPGAVYRMESFEQFSERAVEHVTRVTGTGAATGEAGPFAAIVMSQVLEHALDPMDWLRRAAALLGDGGILAVAVPNFAGVYRLLGRRDPFLIPPIHLNFFTRRSLSTAMARAGLSVVRADSRNRIGVSPRPGARGRVIRAAATTWNLVSRPLDHTALGVILRVFAARRAIRS